MNISNMVPVLAQQHGEGWAAYMGDCCDVIRGIPDNSIDLAVYSPPFSGLYIYSESERDMGNSADDAEFFRHYDFLCTELQRVMRPGRQVWVHCKDLVYYQNQRGTAGLRDFPGDLIRAHVKAGFDYHARRTVWRCPVREMTKTKAHGLLYKQLRADSTYSRAGLPEYMLTFRKWARDGQSEVPVTHTPESFPLPQWQNFASSVWDDTRETDVLNGAVATEPSDEKHICPLPLDLIERAVILGSNRGETVFSPFMGIGSEGHGALRLGRRFVGVELKESYWRQACRNLAEAERVGGKTLFDLAGDGAAA